jgi:hypothetical protein
VSACVVVAVTVGLGVDEAVGVRVGLAGGVMVMLAVGLGVGGAGQPASALFTARTSASMVTLASPSKARQPVGRMVPSAMLTPVISSSTVTAPESSQSPTQAGTWATATRALSTTSTGPHASRTENE